MKAHVGAGSYPDQACEFTQAEDHAGPVASVPCRVERLAKNFGHFRSEDNPIIRRIKKQEPAIESYHYAPLETARKPASCVRCFIRAISVRSLFRPSRVRRYACRPREDSFSAKRSIQ